MYIINDDIINQQEQKGRAVFLSIHSGMTWTTSTNKYDVWDVSGSTRNTDMFVEIKDREIKSTIYPTTFLQVDKYNNLMQLPASSQKKAKAFYFVNYTDGRSYVFDLANIDNIDQYRSKRWMKDVSLENQDLMIEKEIYELPLALAVKSYR